MKGLKKVVSGLVAAIMVMSSLVTSVGAEGDTTNAEAAFSLKYLDSLPKEGEENFNEFLKLPDIKKLDEKREKNVKHKDGTIENVKINEEEVYGKIEKEILDENIRKEYESLPEKMKIARAIYEWVANNIEYDYESYENVKKYYTDSMAYDESATKPQDAFFVYEKKTGMCAGKADLTALMMKIAEIPSAYVVSIKGKDGMDHAFNAIYLGSSTDDRKGWVLLDPTWGAPNSDCDLRKIDENAIKEMINSKGECVFGPKRDGTGTDYENLSCDFLAFVRDLYLEETKQDRQYAYKEAVKKLFNMLLKKRSNKLEEKNKVFLQKNLDNINLDINSELNKLNQSFKDTVVIKKFNIYIDDCDDNGNDRDRRECLFCDAETSLNMTEAARVLQRQRQGQGLLKEIIIKRKIEQLKEYFPAAYNIKLNFKSSNEEIIKHDVHTIKTIDCYGNKNKAYGDYYKHEFKIDGAKYELDGTEGSAYIKLSGKDGQPATDVKIPFDITKLGMIFNVGSGIESLNLQGDEILDLSGASMLKKINAEKSNKYINKYIAKAGILFDKNTNEVKSVFNQKGKTEEGLDYQINMTDNSSEIDSISLASLGGEKYKDVRIPECLTQCNVPIEICEGIESLILEGDEVVNLHYAFELESIDITNSTRYEKRDGKIFDKKLNKELELRENKKVAIINNK